MTRFLDKRSQGRHKSAVNRQRFIKRFKSQIKHSVSEATKKRNLADIENGESVTIPIKDIKEPTFHYGPGGKTETVLPGNEGFSVGDRIKRPPSITKSSSSQASDTGIGEDDFMFKITGDEFIDLLFDDLELPNLAKKQFKITSKKMVRKGITTQGTPANINILRTFRGAIGRKIAVSGSIKAKIHKLEKQLTTSGNSRQEILDEIEHLKSRLKNIPFIDPIDLRYNNRIYQSQPTTQAVMFCVMDVSGSMDEKKKDIAKRFFILLYLFLKKNYDAIEVVFIRHHTSAKEVSEQDFFYSRETGGTVVSSSLELMRDIITHRYPKSEWNIYGAQASDGDNWNNDSPRCRDILLHDIMPHVQYYAYVEIMPRHHQSLWEAYQTVKEASQSFEMQHISHQRDIFPVFKNLFKRQHPAVPN